jgi:hypothetical protein
LPQILDQAARLPCERAAFGERRALANLREFYAIP